MSKDYIVEGDKVYDPPKVKVTVGKEVITKKFCSIEEALAWAEELREKSGKLFEII